MFYTKKQIKEQAIRFTECLNLLFNLLEHAIKINKIDFIKIDKIQKLSYWTGLNHGTIERLLNLIDEKQLKNNEKEKIISFFENANVIDLTDVFKKDSKEPEYIANQLISEMYDLINNKYDLSDSKYELSTKLRKLEDWVIEPLYKQDKKGMPWELKDLYDPTRKYGRKR